MPTENLTGGDNSSIYGMHILQSKSQQSNEQNNGDMAAGMNSQENHEFEERSGMAGPGQPVPSQVSAACNKKKITPSPDDILMGRGWPYQRYPGNLKFRRFVEGYRAQYHSAPRYERREVVLDVLRILKQKGCRFLISKNGKDSSSGPISLSDVEWKIASKGEAYEKVSHTLRGKSRNENTPQSTFDENNSASSVVVPQHQVDNPRRADLMDRRGINHPCSDGHTTNISNEAQTRNEDGLVSIFVAARPQQSDILGLYGGNSLDSSSSHSQLGSRYTSGLHLTSFVSDDDRANGVESMIAESVLSSSNMVPDTGSTTSSGATMNENVGGVGGLSDGSLRTMTISLAIREYLDGNSEK